MNNVFIYFRYIFSEKRGLFKKHKYCNKYIKPALKFEQKLQPEQLNLSNLSISNDSVEIEDLHKIISVLNKYSKSDNFSLIEKTSLNNSIDNISAHSISKLKELNSDNAPDDVFLIKHMDKLSLSHILNDESEQSILYNLLDYLTSDTFLDKKFKSKPENNKEEYQDLSIFQSSKSNISLKNLVDMLNKSELTGHYHILQKENLNDFIIPSEISSIEKSSDLSISYTSDDNSDNLDIKNLITCLDNKKFLNKKKELISYSTIKKFTALFTLGNSDQLCVESNKNSTLQLVYDKNLFLTARNYTTKKIHIHIVFETNSHIQANNCIYLNSNLDKNIKVGLSIFNNCNFVLAKNIFVLVSFKKTKL